MPIPVPATDEPKDQFIQRCMGDDVMVQEYSEEAQRAAVCESASELRPADKAEPDAKAELEAEIKADTKPVKVKRRIKSALTGREYEVEVDAE